MITPRIAGVGLVGGVLLGAMNAPGEVIVLTPAADTSIFLNQFQPGALLSNGSGDGVFAGRTFVHASFIQRGLMRFDLSGIPCGARVTDVRLTMTLVRAPSGAGAQTVRLHRVLAAWGEGASNSFGGQGEDSQAGDANWYERFHPGAPWTNPGGDFVEAESAGIAVAAAEGAYTWTSTPGLIGDVTDWLAHPERNFGWMLITKESTQGTARKYASREAVDAGTRPTLRIEYVMGSCCGADFNGDGVLDPDDLSDYIGAFFSVPPDPRADFSGDGVIDPDDLSDYIGAFFSGCP